MRVGIGYDIHALKKGRPFILGGVRIPFARGSVSHSDGDVLLHAIVDALLGAAAAGDIGSFFPDTDPRWKGASSLVFIQKTRQLLRKKKLKIMNIDSVVIAEAPKLLSYRDKMRRVIAKALGVSTARVSVKAKTHEKLGELGRGRAIACTAVASLKG